MTREVIYVQINQKKAVLCIVLYTDPEKIPKNILSYQDPLSEFNKQIFTIADAKRGDIGNTSAMYARAFFEKEKSGFDFDAVTVAPYMGEDSVTPFLQYKNKWVILLALTS